MAARTVIPAFILKRMFPGECSMLEINVTKMMKRHKVSERTTKLVRLMGKSEILNPIFSRSAHRLNIINDNRYIIETVFFQ